MKRRDFLRSTAFVSTGLLFVPKRMAAQSISVLTAPGTALIASKKAASGGGGGGGDTTTGLIGWWKLDDGSGSTAVDSSVSGNNGTLINSPTWTTGHINGALQFSAGSSQKVTANTTAIGGLTTASIAGWINRSSTGNQVHFGAGSIDANNRFSFQWYTDGNIYCAFGNASSIQYAFCALSGTGWHHVAMTFDGSLSGNSKIKIYIDGVAQTPSFNTSPPTALPSSGSFGNFVIGVDAVGSSFTTGIIDDVRIYNRVLATADVSALAAM